MNARLFTTSMSLHLKSLLRMPAYWVPMLVFPVMLFTMFGWGRTGLAGAYLMASFVVYGVIGVAFFQFGISIAQERESQWERYRRTLPSAAAPRIASQVASALLFALASAALVICAAYLFSTPDASAGQIVRLLVAASLITVPFTLAGTALGYWTTAKSAVPIANLLYLPLAYLGGLWMPPESLPSAISSVSNVTPTRHAGEIAWAIVGGRHVPLTGVAWLAGYSVLFTFLAFWGYRRDERQRYA